MRIFGILIAATLLGLLLAVLLVEPDIAGAHRSAAPGGVLTACERGLCENATWLRAPAVRRATFSR
jgi:hypothetical protein